MAVSASDSEFNHLSANSTTDPNQITINGGSAGAGSVRTLLGSPKAIGKFAGAWAMSNLGGGQDLGLGGNYVSSRGLDVQDMS